MTATAQQIEFLRESIKTIPDYPKPGILFRDVTSMLEDPKAYALSISFWLNATAMRVSLKSWVLKLVVSCLVRLLHWRLA